MALLRAPTGETQEVPDSLVQHYISRGATLADGGPDMDDGAAPPDATGQVMGQFLSERAVPAATGAAVAGGLLAVPPVARGLGRVGAQLSREPGLLGSAARGARALFGREPRAPGPAPSPETPEPVVPTKSVARHSASRTEVTQDLLDRFPEQLRNYRPGDTIGNAALDKIRTVPPEPQPGSVASRRGKYPTRPITIVEGAKRTPAGAPAPTPESPGAGRGKSRPQIERETAFRAKAVERAKAAKGERTVVTAAIKKGLKLTGWEVGETISTSALKRIAGGKLSSFLKSMGGISPVDILEAYSQIDPEFAKTMQRGEGSLHSGLGKTAQMVKQIVGQYKPINEKAIERTARQIGNRKGS